MTEFEFSQINPKDTGDSLTPPASFPNINLLISCSMYPDPAISGSPHYPSASAPIYLMGVTIPTTWVDPSGTVNLTPTLSEISSIKVPYPGVSGSGYVDAPVIGRQHKNEYYFLRTEKTLLSTLIPSISSSYVEGSGAIGYYYVIDGSELIFNPFYPESFNSYAYNPLINNSEQSRRSVVRQVVGRSEDQIKPTNLTAILSQSAEQAQVQDSNYSKIGTIRGRYAGSVMTDGGVRGNDPEMTIRSFTGSVHPSGSNINAIKADTNLTFKSIYFNVNKIPLHRYMTGSYLPNIDTSFPSPSGSLILVGNNYITSGSLLYEEKGNNLARLVNSKVFARDRNIFFVTNELGYVTSEES